MPYTHLLYVRKYSILDNDYKLYVYAVNTKDIYHTIGEYYARSLEQIKDIRWNEYNQSSLNYLKEKGIEILSFKNKYEIINKEEKLF